MTKMPVDAVREPFRDVVRILLDLYGVVIALALTTAIGFTVAPNGIALSPFELSYQNLATFGSLFITIVPFYHGASIYMLNTYRSSAYAKKKGAALVDFFVLALEGVVFYAMGSSIHFLGSFMLWFIILLLIDLFWYGFTYFKAGDSKESAPKWWPRINGGTILALLILSSNMVQSAVQVYAVLFAIAAVRTVLDYSLCYDYYFPQPTQT
jgi:hypothetical protein